MISLVGSEAIWSRQPPLLYERCEYVSVDEERIVGGERRNA